MKSNYRFANSEEQDLEEISDYLVEAANSKIAARVLNRIVDTVVVLAAQPKIGKLVAVDDEVLRFPSGQYMIYYVVRKKGIEVLHIFHGSRDQGTALREKQ